MVVLYDDQFSGTGGFLLVVAIAGLAFGALLLGSGLTLLIVVLIVRRRPSRSAA
ncbi:MAG: hypothetical protein JF888_00300 [Candidatus Dormibacteraeota bacterium]|uniref:Uncharacterized protein n=1 Tax=Candidatus Dormiibacter inghamiae TaxID=3127013 RepID=A0A934KA55_9BACT|nr:hypothetical protein [Candidatus Dormibacteraeota bacterium]MBJ7606857.1 hypothetical protein [Candidatus Dormibacteraeota bacterium]